VIFASLIIIQETRAGFIHYTIVQASGLRQLSIRQEHFETHQESLKPHVLETLLDRKAQSDPAISP
jgi:hypothetical protein